VHYRDKAADLWSKARDVADQKQVSFIHTLLLGFSSSLPMLPHSGQSSQLVFDANDGNAQFLPKLAGAVVWHTRHKSFKRVVR
jgi:hypothetical protein